MNILEKLRKMLDSKKKQETEERIYILDTCALHSSEAMKIIEEASKVIILTGTIRELDNHKYDGGSFGKNVKAIGKKSRLDEKSEKYICINGYEKYKYQDDNIIDYCREHKNVTIITCDNYLCNMAKAYGIRYIFPKRNDEKVQVNNEQKSAKNVQKENTATEVRKKKYANTSIKDVKYKNEALYSVKSQSPNSNVVVRNGKVIKDDFSEGIRLKIGDIIFRIIPKKENVLVMEYQIDEIKNTMYAHEVKYVTVDSITMESLDKNNNLPKEVKEKILSLFNGKEENSTEIKETIQNAEQEIIFYNGWIRAQNNNHANYIKVERQGRLIKTQDYAEGDLLYLLKYNKKKNNLKIHVYKIVIENNQYVAEKLEEYKLCLVNEIYRLKLSEELQDEIRSFFVKHARY